MIREWLSKSLFPVRRADRLPLAKFVESDEAKRLSEINGAIATLNDAAKEFSSSSGFDKEYLDLIHQADVQATAKRWTETHETIWEATFLVNRARETRETAALRRWIAYSLVAWLLVLLVVGLWLKGEETREAGLFGLAYWRYLLMGALGGVTVALWGLVKHTTALDFDVNFTTWYMLRPVLGAITGLVAVAVILAGLFTIQRPSEPSSALPPYDIVAFLAGFSERFFIRIIDRVMTALFEGGSESSSGKAGGPRSSRSS